MTHPEYSGTGSHILCLDDDELVLCSVIHLLELRGYRVSGFQEQGAALAAVRANPAEFDAVISDYNLRGISGLEVASEIRAIRSDLPIALTSGWIDDKLRSLAMTAGVCELVPKPFVIHEFYAVVQRLANGQGRVD